MADVDPIVRAMEIVEQSIPFNRVLGLRDLSVVDGVVEVRFSMRDDLIGNFSRGSFMAV